MNYNVPLTFRNGLFYGDGSAPPADEAEDCSEDDEDAGKLDSELELEMSADEEETSVVEEDELCEDGKTSEVAED